MKNTLFEIKMKDGYLITYKGTDCVSVIIDGVISEKFVSKLTECDFVGIDLFSDYSKSKFEIPIVNKICKGHCYIGWYPDEKEPIDLAAFLGLMISEGYYSIKKNFISVGISSTDKEFVEKIDELFNHLFKLPKSYKISTRYKEYTPLVVFRKTSIDCVLWLQKLKLGNNASTKCIPKCVFSWPKKYQAELLKWYFEGDGTIKPNRNGCLIGCSTKSKQLSQDIVKLLLNFGIICSISEERRHGYPEIYYAIYVKTTKSVNLFMSTIGFITSRKNNRFISTVSFTKDYNFIPNSNNLLKTLKPFTSGLGRIKLRECLRDKTPIRLSTDRLKLILKGVNLCDITADGLMAFTNLEKFSRCNISWQAIESITKK